MKALCDNTTNMNDMDNKMNDMYINMQNKKALMLEIMKYQLVALDSALFLDTHPNDPIALIRHHEYTTRLKQLKDEFTTKYGPMDIYTPDMAGTWRYIDSPWPWEW